MGINIRAEMSKIIPNTLGPYGYYRLVHTPVGYLTLLLYSVGMSLGFLTRVSE